MKIEREKTIKMISICSEVAQNKCVAEECPFYKKKSCKYLLLEAGSRLYQEKKDTLEFPRKAIAIDFDGCLCEDAFPAVGAPNYDVIQRALEEQHNGAGLILWTCREGKLLEDALVACTEWGLIFDAVNESLPSWKRFYGSDPRKVGASEYWDDRNVAVLTSTSNPSSSGQFLLVYGWAETEDMEVVHSFRLLPEGCSAEDEANAVSTVKAELSEFTDLCSVKTMFVHLSGKD